MRSLRNATRRRCTPHLVVAAVSVLTLAACGSSGPIEVVVSEFSIELERDSHPADQFPMEVDHLGELRHKLVFIRTDRPVADLIEELGDAPVLPSGEIDLAGVSGLEVIDEMPMIGPGRYRSTAVNIPPGDYYVICTVSSPEVGSHVRQGMIASIHIDPNPNLY